MTSPLVARPMAEGLNALTEKEKDTLRLLIRGHDAKSVARALGLSVHTVNERLRDARRKLAVSSSREAARLLFENEVVAPESVGDKQIGEAAAPPAVQAAGQGRWHLAPALIGGLLMSLALALAAALTFSPPAAVPAAAPTEDAAQVAEMEAAARRWLLLVDAGKWQESWAATGSSFRTLNTAQVWAAASERARGKVGAVRTRTFLSHASVPAPPDGYEMLKFRTDFANHPGATETLGLVREDGTWKVVGIWIE